MFTQPHVYDTIAKQEPMLKKYMQCLAEEGSFTQSNINNHQKWVWGMLEEAAKKSKSYQPKECDIHKNLRCILKMRGKMVEEGKNINMSTAEVLAFGLLVKESYYICLLGQDAKQGTFLQQHLVLHNQIDKRIYTLLQHIDKKQVPFVACNLLLSKFGCMGFELGFLPVDPKNLMIWEVQFGNFAKNVQCIIDQFIALREHKWLQCTSLVLNLLHSYDGQGPKHLSMHIECFLQLCNNHPFCFPMAKKNNHKHQDSNMAIVYPTMCNSGALFLGRNWLWQGCGMFL
ncbi:2-oxoglutarate dehydrogenase E1 component [Thecaphora frezii]